MNGGKIKQQMKYDFMSVQSLTEKIIQEIDQEDPRYTWSVQVQKEGIHIFWSYLEYHGKTPPFTIRCGRVDRDECAEGANFLVLTDEHGDYMTGRIPEQWCDGTFEQCVVLLLKDLQYIVNYAY